MARTQMKLSKVGISRITKLARAGFKINTGVCDNKINTIPVIEVLTVIVDNGMLKVNNTWLIVKSVR